MLANVVAFSTDPAGWEALSRPVKRVGTDLAGEFSISRLPPGDYHAVAVAHLPDHSWRRPSVLEVLRP